MGVDRQRTSEDVDQMLHYKVLTFVCLRRDCSLSHKFRNSPGFLLSLPLHAHQTSAESVKTRDQHNSSAWPARRHPEYRKNSPPQKKILQNTLNILSWRIKRMWRARSESASSPSRRGRSKMLTRALIGRNLEMVRSWRNRFQRKSAPKATLLFLSLRWNSYPLATGRCSILLYFGQN